MGDLINEKKHHRKTKHPLDNKKLITENSLSLLKLLLIFAIYNEKVFFCKPISLHTYYYYYTRIRKKTQKVESLKCCP